MHEGSESTTVVDEQTRRRQLIELYTIKSQYYRELITRRENIEKELIKDPTLKDYVASFTTAQRELMALKLGNPESIAYQQSKNNAEKLITKIIESSERIPQLKPYAAIIKEQLNLDLQLINLENAIGEITHRTQQQAIPNRDKRRGIKSLFRRR